LLGDIVKVVSVIGARPQFIKAAMVSRVIRSNCQEILIHTGQHYDKNMSEKFFSELDLPKPDINLAVGSKTHAIQTGMMMAGIEEVLLEQEPDWIIIYGDTNSTLAGSLAAIKIQIPIAHVEAGLRSFNRSMPEEINRVICDAISEVLFCPTEQAVQNLVSEGITKGVYLVGDVMKDALDFYVQLAEKRSNILEEIKLASKSYALATIHRARNTDEASSLRVILDALGNLDLPIILPIHPRTKKAISNFGIELAKNIIPIEPVGYLDMLQLEKNAECILTDSGGVQKEAYWLGVRCITLRQETEWIETVNAGWNRLVGTDKDEIISAVTDWLPQSQRQALYGDGHAAEKIRNILVG
jgi:UDP-GlcNAc3NAcA epimerase